MWCYKKGKGHPHITPSKNKNKKKSPWQNVHPKTSSPILILLQPSLRQYGANTPPTYAEPKSQQWLLREQVDKPAVLLSIPSDSHLCTLHSQHQLASAIQIQMETRWGTMAGDSLRAISSGLLQCLAQRLLALWFQHTEALTPFRHTKGGREKKGAEKKREGCLATARGEEKKGWEWFETACWFSSPDFTLWDESRMVMERAEAFGDAPIPLFQCRYWFLVQNFKDCPIPWTDQIHYFNWTV